MGSRLTILNQSECFASIVHSNATLKFANDILFFTYDLLTLKYYFQYLISRLAWVEGNNI